MRGWLCQDCLLWHFHTLDFLGGAVPLGCQMCERSWELLEAEARTVDSRVSMYAVPKDGIYQLLCSPCKDKYVPKRRDMYGDTAYGHQLKLK